jgi:hypothetical protein
MLITILLFVVATAHSQPITFNTLAGQPAGGTNDGTGISAQFNSPCGVAVDAAGNVYVADTDNHTVRKITPTGTVITLAGLAGASGSADGTGGIARFNQPGGIAVDSASNLYIGDSGNHTIRKITPAGVVSTWAGSAGVSGSADLTGTNAQFFLPQGVAVDSATNVYVADYGNHTIRKIAPDQSVSTLAGLAGSSGSLDLSGSSARFYQPQGVSVDAVGYVYVADTANNTIRKITPGGTVSTLAGFAGSYGSADGAGTNAQFYQPESVSVDSSGNVFVADFINQTIRKVTAGGVVTTVAGATGQSGSADGTNNAARFWGPEGVAVGTGGSVFVADAGNGTIRKITLSGSVATVATFTGAASASSTDGNANNARFSSPGGAASGSATIYVADTANNTIRKLTTVGLASTLAGSAGNAGSSDGSGSAASFYGPQGIAVDWTGNIYVADTANATIRKVSPAGSVVTLTGNAGTNGSLDGTSDALFYQPQAITVDLPGNIYVADTWNHTIRMVTPGGAVSTIAGLPGNFGAADGTNSKARFNRPSGLTVDGAGNLYVSDYFNHTIRKISPSGPTWIVTTIAGLPGVWGKTDGTNSSARFNRPQGISLDGSGNLYVTDSGNETIRKLTPSGTNWIVTTVGGLGGASGSANGTANAARFYSPAGVAVNGSSLYILDSGNSAVRLGAAAAPGAPVIINQPRSLAVNPGSNATFSVTVNGNPTLSYQWRFNGSNLTGMTASSYTRTNAQPGDAGNYSAFVTNAFGSVQSADAALTVNSAPYIITQPQGQIVSLGQSASFSIAAGGGAPLSYQWRFQGSDIPGANGSSYTIGSAQGTNQGAYSVAVNNSAGGVVSADAVLSIFALAAVGDDSLGQTDVPGIATNTIEIAAGGWHNLALRVDGSVVAWGNDFNGQCEVPPELTDALAIAAGGYHSLAIRRDGTLVAWGANDYGQTNIPAGPDKVLAVAAGTWHNLALRMDGTLTAWGDNSHNETNIPAGLTNVTAISAGGSHCLALRSDGTVVAWGDNTDDVGTFVGESVVPVGLSNVIAIAAGQYHSLAAKSDGTVVAWGANGDGQCTVPAGLSNVVALAGGGAHSLALKSDGTVVAWGADWDNQCDLPVLSAIVGIGAGAVHTVLLVESTLPERKLLNPSIQSARFSALLQTLNRKHYALEYATSLPAVQWNGVATNAGNGALEILADPSANAPRRFYRMRQW